jgi:hypothetical protein
MAARVQWPWPPGRCVDFARQWQGSGGRALGAGLRSPAQLLSCLTCWLVRAWRPPQAMQQPPGIVPHAEAPLVTSLAPSQALMAQVVGRIAALLWVPHRWSGHRARACGRCLAVPALVPHRMPPCLADSAPLCWLCLCR